MKRKIVMILAVISLFGLFSSCGQNTKLPESTPNPPIPSESPADISQATGGKNPIVTITMEDGRLMQAELYPDVAPNTVNSFISLINSGFYDGLTFHRAVPDFMIQGGDPDGNGGGGPGYSIKGEFSDNGFANNLTHTKGALSMARSRIPDSAGSQFFIVVGDASFLDKQYAAFGKIISGQDVADDISVQPTASEILITPAVIKSITVDTFGADYPEPEKVK